MSGAIGYVEYAFAKQNNLSHALLANRDGAFVAPDAESFQAAAANADWANAPGYYIILTDQPGAGTWPITAATFILLPARAERPDRASQVLRFFDWAYAQGDAHAEALHYVPLPDPVVERVEQTWAPTTGPAGRPLQHSASE